MATDATELLKSLKDNVSKLQSQRIDEKTQYTQSMRKASLELAALQKKLSLQEDYLAQIKKDKNNQQLTVINLGQLKSLLEDIADLLKEANDKNEPIDEHFDIEVDEKSKEGITYLGEAKPGSSLDKPVWRIKKIITKGSKVTVSWANGNSDFDNVWSDRENIDF